MKRLLTAMMTLAAFALTIGPASAHSRLISTVPAGGATVTTALSEVVLEFSEPIESAFGGVQIFDMAGTRIASGDPQITGKTVKVALTPQPAGDYTVAYRIISSDSHPVESRFAFNYQPPASAAASAVAPADPVTGVEGLPGGVDQAAGANDSWWSQYKFLAIGAAVFLLVAVVVMRPGSTEPLQPETDS